MTKARISEAIDALGKLRDRLHLLTFQERSLAGELREALAAVKGKKAAGKTYLAELIGADKVEIVDLTALRKVAGRKFLQVVRADIAAARRLLGGDAVKRLGKKTRSWQLRVYKAEPGKAPRKAPGRK